ncbi:MAG: hypothetical protein VB018_03835 [Lachnospiraceae bacterium]|nr:hypothetical protein [Lachnospiraceae bacterium]
MKRNSSKQLTRINKKGVPELINKLYIERAIATLYEYESTGLTPWQIGDLQETINNQLQRIKKLEDWQ